MLTVFSPGLSISFFYVAYMLPCERFLFLQGEIYKLFIASGLWVIVRKPFYTRFWRNSPLLVLYGCSFFMQVFNPFGFILLYGVRNESNLSFFSCPNTFFFSIHLCPGNLRHHLYSSLGFCLHLGLFLDLIFLEVFLMLIIPAEFSLNIYMSQRQPGSRI